MKEVRCSIDVLPLKSIVFRTFTFDMYSGTMVAFTEDFDQINLS